MDVAVSLQSLWSLQSLMSLQNKKNAAVPFEGNGGVIILANALPS